MSDQTMEEKIEALAQQLTRFGMPIDRARALLQAVIYAPVTHEEIKEALGTLEEKPH